MNKTLVVLALFAAVPSTAAGVFAQTTSAPGPTDGAAHGSAVPSTAQEATTLSVRGTIDKYDQATRTLVLSTPGGAVSFPVAAATRIRQGGQDVDAKKLPNLAGRRATVRYTESGGQKIVESVHVFPK